MTKANQHQLTVTITLDDERLFDLLHDNDIKRPSMAKVKKLKKLFEEVLEDFYPDLEEAVEEALTEIIEEEWGE